jgi:hypothetical protein
MLSEMSQPDLVKVASVLEERFFEKLAADHFTKIGRDLCDEMAKSALPLGSVIAGARKFVTSAGSQARTVTRSAASAAKNVPKAVKGRRTQQVMAAGRAAGKGVSENPQLRKAVIGGGLVAGGYAAGKAT